ncbi:MAG TPA: hypothetical protein PK323_07520 [Bacteroidia bacterium]|nr:hypothetical protein [Bacteroidia bacterium]
MKNMFRTLQIIWLIAAVGALIGAVINALNNKFQEAGIFIAITFIGAYMYGINKKRIKNIPNESQKTQTNSTLS